jgi:hypothetical protein
VHRQYAIDTAKELWWPLAISAWICEILDYHLRKLHAEYGRAVNSRAAWAAAAGVAASANGTASANVRLLPMLQRRPRPEREIYRERSSAMHGA